MSREVVVALEFGRESIAAQSRIGAQVAREFAWEAPPPSDPPFWATGDGDALVLEVLALMHLPNVDRLVIAVPPTEVMASRAAMQEKFTGAHDLRNTECRSQRLAVNVRSVEVVPLPLSAPRPGSPVGAGSAG